MQRPDHRDSEHWRNAEHYDVHGLGSAMVALDNGWPLIGKPTDLRLIPIQLEAAGVRDELRTLLLNPIDGPQNIGLGDLRSWTTDHVPTARIGNQQAAIRIFDHIRRMKVGLIAFKETARVCKEWDDPDLAS